MSFTIDQVRQARDALIAAVAQSELPRSGTSCSIGLGRNEDGDPCVVVTAYGLVDVVTELVSNLGSEVPFIVNGGDGEVIAH